MKILFVLENLTHRCGANVNIALKLARQLSTAHEVFALTRESTAKPVDPQKAAHFADVITFPADRTDRLSAFLQGVEWSTASGARRIGSLLTHPRMLAYLLDGKYRLCKGMRVAYRRALEQLCAKERFDAVVTFCAPYYLAQVLAEAEVGKAKRVLMQLDAYTYNHTLPPRHTQKRQRLERYVAQRIDHLMAVSFVADEMRERGILQSLEKLTAFQLPGINTDVAPCGGTPLSADADHVHFMFVGQLYADIRSPAFLLELFTRLPANYVLHLVGGGAEGVVNAYRRRLGDRLVCHGWVNSDEATALMGRADVLVNLNNTVRNQLASKILEYINTGKPVLNVCKRTDCPSLPYTAKYANCIDLFETSEPDAAALAAVETFANACKGRLVAKAELLAAFYENTDAFLAEKLIKLL